MEGQVAHSDGNGPNPMEFQSQDTETAEKYDESTHSADDDDVSK